MLSITVEDRQIKAAFSRLQRATGDLKPAMEDIGQYVSRRVDQTFQREEDFYGTPWAALSPKTIKRKQKLRQIPKTLQATGTFRGSFSYTADRRSVEIGSNRVGRNGIPIGLIHQRGSRRVPKRPVLPEASRGLPPADREEVLAIIEDHITDAW